MSDITFKSKHFGEIVFEKDDTNLVGEVNIDGQERRFFFFEYNLYGEKINLCFDMIDRYFEIHQNAIKAISENFPQDEVIHDYFKFHFDELPSELLIDIFGTDKFENLDINTVVEKLKYPNFLIGIEDNKIELSVDYMISKEYSDAILCVNMGEDLNILGFSHES
jgi:hypothetical protein